MTRSGKQAVRAATSRHDEDSDDDELRWRWNSAESLPPPRRWCDEGAGPSGHGASSWMHVDVNDPRYQRVLKKLEEADAAGEEEAAFRRAQAEQRAATKERLRARRQAVKDAAASSSEGSRPPSPPPSPPSDPPPAAVAEETVRRLLAEPAVASRLHATVTGAMRAEGDL